MTNHQSLIGLHEEDHARTMPSSEASQGRRQVSLIVFGTLVLLALGVWGNWPWLATEHVRLKPLQQCLIWAGDGTALLWTLWLGLWHGVFGIPLPLRAASDRGFWWVLLTLCVGMTLDGLVTGASAYQEEAGNRRAVPSPQAFLTAGRASLNGELAYVACWFQDQAGGWHESRFDLAMERHPALAAAIQGAQFPIGVQIRYDPDWPPRCWLNPDNLEHQPLYWLSLCILTFQGILTISAAACYWNKRGLPNRLPIHRLVPAWAVAVPLGCAALGKLLSGEF
jgi:hypothetical protein